MKSNITVVSNKSANSKEESKMVNVNGVSKVERYNAYLEKLEAVRDVYSCGNDWGISINFDTDKGYITFVDSSMCDKFNSPYFDDVKIAISVSNVWNMQSLYVAISNLVADKHYWVTLLNNLIKDGAADNSSYGRNNFEFYDIIEYFGNWSGTMIRYFEALLERIDTSITGCIAKELKKMDMDTLYGLACSFDIPEYKEDCEYTEF